MLTKNIIHFFKLAFIIFFICNSVSFANETLTIAVTSGPHAEILAQVKEKLAKEGIDLKIKEFSDYIQPNLAVAEHYMDANYFQHLPYLNTFNQDYNINLVALSTIHIEPMGIYSTRVNSKPTWLKNIKKLLPNNLKIGVPNDPTNEGRALNLLKENGFLGLKETAKFPTKRDIINNTHKIKIVELEAAILPKMLSSKQLDLAVINSNFALAAKMSPISNPLILESKNSPYANIIVVRATDLKNPKLLKLVEALHSEEIRKYIKNTYKGAVLPAF